MASLMRATAALTDAISMSKSAMRSSSGSDSASCHERKSRVGHLGYSPTFYIEREMTL